MAIYVALAILGVLSASLSAQPAGMSPVKGEVSFEQTGNALTLTAADGTVMEWQNFSILENETLHIDLPSKDSWIEMRVASDSPALVVGKLTSNGSVTFIHAEEIINKGVVSCEGDVIMQARKIVNKARIAGKNVALFAEGCTRKELAIDNNGVICAHDAKGSIDLRAQAGIVLHQNLLLAESGKVVLTGDVVQLKDGSLIDVSGAAEGGEVYVGGGWQGQDATIANAKATFVHPQAKIAADSTTSGDGGTVVIWGDKVNRFFGTISAEGAGRTGKGGDVEVSAKGQLSFEGKVNVSAPVGPCGTVLLDPLSITINSGSPNIGGTGGDITNLNQLDDALLDYPGVNSIITAGALSSLLTGTPSSATLAAVNFITVNAAVSAAGPSGTNLFLNAPTINLNAPISLPFGGTLDGSAFVVNVGPTGTAQNGVDTAGTGGIVYLSAGTYQEQVTITTPLTLSGAGRNSTTILAPATLTNSFTSLGLTYFPVVIVNGVTGGHVNVQNLTVNANFAHPGVTGALLSGVGYYNTDGTVLNVHTLNTAAQYPPGVGVGLGIGISGLYDLNTHEFSVNNCLTERFDRIGIDIRTRSNSARLSSNVQNSTITGPGASALPTGSSMSGLLVFDNGTSRNCSITVDGNTIQGMNANESNPALNSTGMSILGTLNPVITNNICIGNDRGIQLQGALSPYIAYNNISSNSPFPSPARGTGIISLTPSPAGSFYILSNTFSDCTVNGINISGNTAALLDSYKIYSNQISNCGNGMLLQNTARNTPFFLSDNIISGGTVGVQIVGNAAGVTGPVVNFNQDIFIQPFGTTYIQPVNSPNPYTGTFYLE